jgi:hypothetical protein
LIKPFLDIKMQCPIRVFSLDFEIFLAHTGLDGITVWGLYPFPSDIGRMSASSKLHGQCSFF